MSSFTNFFFFQAEDGIRDLTVTGVQTCALPISMDRTQCACNASISRPVHCCSAASSGAGVPGGHRPRLADLPARSEERRVGKECRCRWWRYHLKKKQGE